MGDWLFFLMLIFLAYRVYLNIMPTAFPQRPILVSIIEYAAMFPALACYTLLGNNWINRVQDDDSILNKHIVILYWLSLSYAYIIFKILCFTFSIYDVVTKRNRRIQIIHMLRQYNKKEILKEINALYEQKDYNYSDQFIDSFHAFTIRGLQLNEFYHLKCYQSHYNGICSLCLCNSIKGDKIRILGCGHKFHIECIDLWLTNEGTCAYCLKLCSVLNSCSNSSLEESLLGV